MNRITGALHPIAALMIVGSAMPGCSAAVPVDQKGQGVSDATTARPEAIARRIGITLPPGAIVDYAQEIDGRDDAARLALVMSDADWKTLQGSLPLTAPDQPPFSPDANFHLGPDEGEWAPGRAAGLTTIQLPWRKGTESLNVGVAPGDAGRTRVFIFWHRL